MAGGVAQDDNAGELAEEDEERGDAELGGVRATQQPRQQSASRHTRRAKYLQQSHPTATSAISKPPQAASQVLAAEPPNSHVSNQQAATSGEPSACSRATQQPRQQSASRHKRRAKFKPPSDLHTANWCP
ncbi:hypothetical protein CYMTET_50430 [Cymbomonas tetramitiformis]|uniref:Uncharacterized protein n=1 Tax=Cymbomonas tetramitiformis TaxID=36881 RepID=A0AAE0BPS4_9CHLO|nr:hypothetical protein CYMTET_50430 [Cymbomonas tetramitiformis]